MSISDAGKEKTCGGVHNTDTNVSNVSMMAVRSYNKLVYELREYVWELHDDETVQAVAGANSGDRTHYLSLMDMRERDTGYNI